MEPIFSVSLAVAQHIRPCAPRWRVCPPEVGLSVRARIRRGRASRTAVILTGMSTPSRNKDNRDSASSAESLLEELVRFVACYRAERHDEASRSNAKRPARPSPGKKDSSVNNPG
jgi:hypothetical protein